MLPSTSFGALVQQRRKALGLTQNDLADQVGCSRETIRKIEAGKRRPSQPMAERIVQFLAVSPGERPSFLRVARVAGEADMPRPSPSSGAGDAAAPADDPRPQLPPSPRPLVGREPAAQQIEALLLRPDLRLLTLTGLPGVGKTQLALHVAARLRDSFADGVRFASLAPLADARAVPAALAAALGVPPSGDRLPAEQLRSALQGRRLLLVIDNFEHVEVAAPLLAELFAAADGLTLLVTSRSVLQLAGEHIYPLQPLAVPELTLPTTAEDLSAVASVALFVRRAQEARADFRLDERNAGAVAAICAAVEGLPLALELAAAWVRALPCAEIARELARGQELLVSRRRDVPERQRSIEAALEASWALLDDPEREVLERLAVFRGSFDRAAAAGVAGASLTTLAALIDHSLLRQEDNGRYTLHELVRQYAQRRLSDGQPDDPCRQDRTFDARRSHTKYYLARAEEARVELYGPKQEHWLHLLEMDLDNIRAALRWLVSEPSDFMLRERASLALRLATALERFWIGRGYITEGRTWLAQALALAERRPEVAPPGLRLRGLEIAGWLAKIQGHIQAAQALLQAALVLARQLADQLVTSNILDILGDLALYEGEHQASIYFYEESLALRRQEGRDGLVALSLYSLGQALVEAGELTRAEAVLREALELSEQVADQRGVALSLYAMGMAAFRGGRHGRADGLFRDALRRFAALGNQVDIGLSLIQLGDLAAEAAIDTGGRGCAERAVRLWGAGHALLNTLGVPLGTAELARHRRREQALYTSLAPEHIVALGADGAAQPLEAIVALAVGQG